VSLVRFQRRLGRLQKVDIEHVKTPPMYNTEGKFWQRNNRVGLTMPTPIRGLNQFTTNYLGKTTPARVRQNEKNFNYRTGGDDARRKNYMIQKKKYASGIKDIQNNMSYKDFKYDIYDRTIAYEA
jgi:hypothetical protein